MNLKSNLHYKLKYNYFHAIIKLIYKFLNKKNTISITRAIYDFIIFNIFYINIINFFFIII